jgi:cytochrome c oxidase assembly factor CtaG
MRWWCSSQSVAWEWTWRPYLGVWILLLALGILYAWNVHRVGAADRGRALLFAAGLVMLWAALDWPLGPLGASYLASVHVLQFLLIALVAPPFLLAGVPPALFHRLHDKPGLFRFIEHVTHPVVAFLIFNSVMTLGHWPSVVDTLMVSQLGSFALDITWLAGGVIFWWPVAAPVPARPKFSIMLQIAYLAANGLLLRPPSVIMLYAKFPVYALYELAPPIPGTSAIDDQQLAGVVMKVGSAWIMMAGVAVLFLLWYRQVRSER